MWVNYSFDSHAYFTRHKDKGSVSRGTEDWKHSKTFAFLIFILEFTQAVTLSALALL